LIISFNFVVAQFTCLPAGRLRELKFTTTAADATMSPEPFLLSHNVSQNALLTGIKTIVENLGKCLLDFVFPLRCPGCSKKGTWFCDDCLAKLRPVEALTCAVCGGEAIRGYTHPRCQTKYALDRLISIYQYEGAIKKAIAWLKYKNVTGLAKVLADLMVEEVGPLAEDFAGMIVIPVPLHWRRSWKRGFNQAELLARPFAKDLGIEVRDNLLRRTRYTKPQIELKHSERQKNVSGAFTVPETKRSEVKGCDFLLLDDVCTTGATLNACANALKRSGARRVWGLTLAG
jgi:ComF family protein